MVIKQKGQIKRNENQVTSRDGTGLRDIRKVYKVKRGQKYTGRERRQRQRELTEGQRDRIEGYAI